MREVATLFAARPNGERTQRTKIMLKKTLIAFTLSLPLLLGNYAVHSAAGRIRSAQPSQKTSDAPTGTLRKMIVENGSVTMDLDLNRLNGISSTTQNLQQMHFAAAADSFFPILIFNDLLRGFEPGSMTLIPQNVSALPGALGASLNRLVVEKLPSGQGFDLAVRDSNTGFTFFNIQGQQYDYDAAAQSLAITNGRLLLSKEFANALGRPSDAGSSAGTIAIGAAMQPIQITQFASGQPRSVVMPPMQHALRPGAPTLVPGPDVIVGDIEDVDQQGSAGTQVGLAIGTDSCNNGDEPIDWFALPDTDHPFIPQNLYRMSGGAENNERFEQIGQSWGKHAFLALEDFVCGTCDTSNCETGTHLCPGCSDPYVSGLNGDQNQIGSRAWVNPFTGSFPSNANDHSGHNHDGVSHRILVEMSDLVPGGNPGAKYFGEAAYITPHEYTWCQSHPDQCNMFNNFSHRQFSVSGGPTVFNFSAVSSTVRMQPAIQAWVATGATVNQVEPDLGNDGIFFVGYKVTNPSPNVWHYEYAIFNMNLDRGIQSFSVPWVAANISNIGFHAPPQHPGWANDGTFDNQGYSSTPWTVSEPGGTVTWNCETFADSENANAIRWGTLYNFRFDADQPPLIGNATVGFFKTGSPITVQVQVPFGEGPTPTPTASPTPTVSPTSTPTPTATPSVTATATPTATPTATATPRATPRPRPTPHPRP
jgi:hypothetical protein